MPIQEVVAGQLYVAEHPVRLAGGRLLTRMTAIVRASGEVLLHSPIPIDAALRAEIDRLGEVRAILAPSNCHHLFVTDAQRAYPGVPTYAVAGVEKKRRDLALLPLTDAFFADDLGGVMVGNRIMHEVVLLHRPSRTVIAVDLVEHFIDGAPGVDRVMRTWLKVMGMWNAPRAAPELRLFTRDRDGARRAIEQILSWDFDRMIIAHGESFDHGAKDAVREAWHFVLRKRRR